MSAERLRLALIGDPVAHSRSPALFAEFFASERIEGSYAALRVPAGEGAAAIARLRAEGYDGLNVTTPLKEEAFASAALRDSSALAARAANVLVLGEQIAAHNSDGIGALGALAAAGLVDLIGKHVLVLGAGPTARAALAALLGADALPALWNRSPERAAELSARFELAPWNPEQSYDAAFSALPPEADLPAALLASLRATPLVLDANYAERATLARRLGRNDIVDGEAMLRASARASFELFRSRR